MSIQVDQEQARLFLQILGKNGNTQMRGFYPTGHPLKAKDPGRKGPLSLDTAAQWQEQGRGVYIPINDGGDTDASITACRALFCEWDDRPVEWQITAWQELNLPEPSCIVLTGGKSAHCYWLFESPISVEVWRELQMRLLEYADADRTLKNPSRVMRLPGAWHLGPDGKPNGQTLIVHRSEHRYSPDDFDFILPSIEAARELDEARRFNVPTALRPHTLAEIKDALDCIPAAVPNQKQYAFYRNLLWALICACQEAGGTADDALRLMQQHSPLFAEAEQVARSSFSNVNAGSFWYHAQKNGYKFTRQQPAQQPSGVAQPSEEGRNAFIEQQIASAKDATRELRYGLKLLEEIESPSERCAALQKLKEATGLTSGKAFDQVIATLIDEQRNDKDCTLAELMERQHDASFIIDQFATTGALIGLGGDKGDGKTVLMYQAAIAVASGEPLFGELTVQRGPAIIVQCDESDLNARKKFILMGADPSLPIHWMWGFNPSMIPELKRKIQKTKAKFVGIDSVTTVAGGRGIKSSDPEFSLFLYQLNYLAAELGVTIVMLIHLRKPDTTKPRTEVGMNDFLGTGMLTSACSDVFGYWSNRQDDAFPDQFILKCLGKRNCEAGVTWDLQGSKEDFSLQFTGVQGGGATPSQRRSVIANALSFLRQRRGQRCSSEFIAQGIGANERTVRRVLGDYYASGNALHIQRLKGQSTGGRGAWEWMF